MLEVSDNELIEKCLKGDQDSFSELITRYKKMIFGVVSYHVNDYEEVNDIAQEVFIRIYKSLGSYNPQFKFSTWSVRIAKNLCVDYLRKKKVQSVSIDEYENVSKDSDTPEEQLVRKERSMKIRKAIEDLPESYRKPIILYHQKGASYKEIAEMLNKPMSIVKNRIYRARLMLRENLLAAGV